MSRILLTNHEEITVKILTKILKTEGYRVVASSSVDQAKELIGKEEYNLMISGATADVDPDMSVVALAREKQKAMPVIILSDSDDL